MSKETVSVNGDTLVDPRLEAPVAVDTSHDDPAHPQNWSKAYKWTIILLISSQALVVNVAIPIIAPAVPQILADLQPNSNSTSTSSPEATFILSVWGLGQMSGPLVFGPLSEKYGRAPPYHITTILFVLFAVGGALSLNVPMVIAFRFLMGFVTIAYTINPTIVGDLFSKEQRGWAMSIVFIAPLTGTLIGPISGGYLTQILGWRWVFWIVAIPAGVFELAMILVYRETYYPYLLRQRVKQERKAVGAEKLPGPSLPLDRDASAVAPAIRTAEGLRSSIVRPIIMLFTSPVVLLVSIYLAVVLGYIYLLVSTMTPIFETSYGIGEGPVGLTFLGIGVGQLIGVSFCGAVMDRHHRRQVRLHHGVSEPEFRLMPMIVAGVLMPIGLFWYGWSVEKHAPIVVPVIGTGFFAIGVAVCQVVSSAYLVDAFGEYAASAVAASMSTRFLSGALLPLAAPSMYSKLGLGWGNSLLGMVALILVPAPGLLLRHGKYLRQKGRYTPPMISKSQGGNLEFRPHEDTDQVTI